MPYGVDPADAMMMARTMWGENEQAGPDEYTAMASVMRNRLLSGDYGGDTMPKVLLAKNQFQAWNNPAAPNYPMKAPLDSPQFRSAYQAASDVMSGLSDNPSDFVNYYNPKGVSKTPSFAAGRQGTPIGQHVFYGPQSELPPEDQAIIDKYYPKQKGAAPSGGTGELTDEDKAIINKYYPNDKNTKAETSETPNARVAGEFEQLPAQAMEPGLREVGPSSETLTKVIGALAGGAGAFGAAKGLQSVISNLPTALPQLAKLLATHGTSGATAALVYDVLGPDKGATLMDIVHKVRPYLQGSTP